MSRSPIILQSERSFVSYFIIAYCLPGMRTGVLFMADSVNVNNHCLVLRVRSPQIPSWTRKVDDGDLPLLTLISCLAIRWKPVFCSQKWGRKHHLTVCFRVFVLFCCLLFFSSPPPSLFGIVAWIWQTPRVIRGKHKPQWNSKYETFIHLSEAKPCWVIALPGPKAQWVRSCYSFNFQRLRF